MKYFLIAGEASGDLHGANLMKALQEEDPDARFRYFGGDRMAGVADGLVVHYREMAYMGYVEVLTHLRAISRNMKKCRESILEFRPDVVILIDYPGFNLRMAGFARRQGFRVFYYISPKLWAWKQGRVKKIRAWVDRLFIILPFEQEFFARHGVEAEYLGNPVVDEVAARRTALTPPSRFLASLGLDERPVLALLPGSRRQELHYHLPVMLEAVRSFTGHHILIAGAPSFTEEDYLPYLGDSGARVVFGATYDLLHASQAALVASGTATLETALMEVPQVVMYRMNAVTYLIGKHFVRVPYISLVNLILGREAVKELIQHEMNPARIRQETERILPVDAPARLTMLDDYRRLQEILGAPGVSRRVAARMVELLKTEERS